MRGHLELIHSHTQGTRNKREKRRLSEWLHWLIDHNGQLFAGSFVSEKTGFGRRLILQ